MNDLSQFWALILDPRNLIVVGLLAMKWRLATTHECPEDEVAWLSRAMRLVRHHSSAIVTVTSLILCPFAHAGEPFWKAFLYGWIYSALAIHAYSLGPKRWFRIGDGGAGLSSRVKTPSGRARVRA